MYVGPPPTFSPLAFLGIDQWKFKFLGRGGDVGWQGFPSESPVSGQSAGEGGRGW